jgi:hypothetical protein
MNDDIWDKIEANLDKRNKLQVATEQTPLQKTNKINKDIEIIINITRAGTYIEPTKHITQAITRKIQNYYTLHDKQIMGYMKHTNNWTYIKNKLYIPRFGSLFLKNKFKNIKYVNHIIPSNPINIDEYLGKFAGNQEVVFNHIMNNQFSRENIFNGRAGLILDLAAGEGKSYLATAIINALKCRTVIVCHNSSILDQWVKLLTKMFPKLTIGQYYGKVKKDGDIVVGIINSLVSDNLAIKGVYNNPREFFDSFDMMIMDEVHEYCSDKRRVIYQVAQCPYMMGLSATPNERSDSLDKINHWGCGPILEAEKLEGYSTDDIPFTGRVTCVKYSGPPQWTEHLTNEKLDITSVPLMIGQFCDDPYRLSMIIELALEQHRKGLNVLIFADRRSYLEQIQTGMELAKMESVMLTNDEELTEFETTAKLQSIRLVGGSSSEEFNSAKEVKNIILATYQFFGTGCSIPKLNSVILTTPRKSKSKQFINRIFRLGSNYDIERQIIDIVDIKTSLKSQWYTRKEYYDKKGYEIDVVKYNWKKFEKKLNN